jgi:hypothetical protein
MRLAHDAATHKHMYVCVYIYIYIYHIYKIYWPFFKIAVLLETDADKSVTSFSIAVMIFYVSSFLK